MGKLELMALKALAVIFLLGAVYANGYYMGDRNATAAIAKQNLKVSETQTLNAQRSGAISAAVAEAKAYTGSFFDQMTRQIEQTYKQPDTPVARASTSPTAKPPAARPLPSPIPTTEPTRETIPSDFCSCDLFLDDDELRLFNAGNKAAEVERPFDPGVAPAEVPREPAGRNRR